MTQEVKYHYAKREGSLYTVHVLQKESRGVCKTTTVLSWLLLLPESVMKPVLAEIQGLLK